MSAEKLIEKVLEFYKESDSGSKILEVLSRQDLLHPSLDKKYILNSGGLKFEITSKTDKNSDKANFYLVASDGCPYLAEVIHDKKWFLKSLRFQCQGCFGDDDRCGVCGGSGWGVL